MAAKSAAWSAVAVLGATIALPLAGALLQGGQLATFRQFPPPLEIPTAYERFSWVAAGAVLALLGAIVASWGLALARRPALNIAADRAAAGPQPRGFGFPGWGWVALAWTVGWWVLAWNRFAWFEPLQRYTFFPLWLGFIVVVNAMTERRSGACLMRRAPARWFGLFAASAVFWWLFEWLNRFVRNWHYLAVEDFSAAGYAVHATLCFSTVLPAVAAVREWIGTSDRVRLHAANGPAWPWLNRPRTGVLLIAASLTALLFTGMRPRHFYPALWVAPLALAWGLAIVLRQPGSPEQVSRGDWSVTAPWILAALGCGFWWELWNWHSLAKWIYTVPYVERWHVFEMPLLGYAGYLPFGLECLLVTERVIGDEALRPGPRTRTALTPRASGRVDGR